MIEVGRLVVKLAGRDAGLKGIIVDVVDDNYVLIDGQVRRKKCNIKHLEPLDKVVKISKNADHKEVVAEFKKLGIEIKEKKAKKEKPAKPVKQRKKKEKIKEEKPKKEKEVKKEVKKETKNKEEKTKSL